MVEEKLKRFLEDSPLSQKASASIKDGREIAMLITAGGTTTPYTFTRSRGKPVFKAGMPQNADVEFVIPETVALEIVDGNFDTITKVGLHIFDRILSNNPEHKIRVKLKTGVMGIMTGGYLGVIATGGSELAQYLAANGLGSLGKIKSVIAGLREKK